LDERLVRQLSTPRNATLAQQVPESFIHIAAVTALQQDGRRGRMLSSVRYFMYVLYLLVAGNASYTYPSLQPCRMLADGLLSSGSKAEYLAVCYSMLLVRQLGIPCNATLAQQVPESYVYIAATTTL
jgi:hypothetical protein